MGCLARISDPEVQGTPFLAGFDRVRFRAPVIPPAVVEYRLKVVQRRMGMTKASGEVWCGGKKVCTARLMGAITTIS
jgi:3-hydroxymyristoyl/3-hydroxydecanoyl-(acyl carrier protein) dehydratase